MGNGNRPTPEFRRETTLTNAIDVVQARAGKRSQVSQSRPECGQNRSRRLFQPSRLLMATSHNRRKAFAHVPKMSDWQTRRDGVRGHLVPMCFLKRAAAQKCKAETVPCQRIGGTHTQACACEFDARIGVAADQQFGICNRALHDWMASGGFAPPLSGYMRLRMARR